MSNCVFVIDSDRKPLKPVHAAVARKMLKSGQAAVIRRYPFTIICQPNISTGDVPEDMEFKVDPGSKTTGIALVSNSKVIWAAELEHRGWKIKSSLEKRRGVRRSRRNRKTRYRPPRFDNRTRPKGWLPPSLIHRVYTIRTWCDRLIKYAGVSKISMELVRFDMQKMQNAEISGVEYQQGELAGYEVREYLLEKFNRICAYCQKTDIPLQIEHITPKARGGSNRVSNLTLACGPCNQKKGSQTTEEFGYPEVQKQAKRPLRDAAAVNATRWRLLDELKATGLPVQASSGGKTKYNRTRFGLPKTHWLDASCVGNVEAIELKTMSPMRISSIGHGSRQMTAVSKHGFPRQKAKGSSRIKGFKTGDMVSAYVTTGKNKGAHFGAVAIRTSGSFRVAKTDGINWKNCNTIQRVDGYAYHAGNSVVLSSHRATNDKFDSCRIERHRTDSLSLPTPKGGGFPRKDSR